MKYSDDECEDIPSSVTNYHFVDDKEEPICFSVLPIVWRGNEKLEKKKENIFLHGKADDGLQKIYKLVTAWKMDLSSDEPKVLVLSKDDNWITLLKPRKSYEETIRTILITVHFLHYVKENPETSGKSLWRHLYKVFSSHIVKPSEKDLRGHLPLVKDAVKRDRRMSNSKIVLAFFENRRKRTTCTEEIGTGSDAKRMKYIVEDDNEELVQEIGATEGDDSDDDNQPFDEVCAICDNGGSILNCKGGCVRSFHACVEDLDPDSNCTTLGLSKAYAEAIPKLICLNCKYNQHQCFVCGKLDSSDRNSGAKVFQCAVESCGHFYHAKCVSELLQPRNEVEAKQLQRRIVGRKAFTCPAHNCFICKGPENEDLYSSQFAVCRRCPRVYHRKCLPREIGFATSKKDGITQRAWSGLLREPPRILIYCLDHEIEDSLATPIRNHLLFPDVEERKMYSSIFQSSQGKVVEKKKSVSEDFSGSIVARTEKLASGKESTAPKKYEKTFSVQRLDSTKRFSTSVSSRKISQDCSRPLSRKVDMVPAPVLDKHQETPHLKSSIKQMRKSSSSQPSVDPETEKRIMMLMKDTASSITMKDVRRNYSVKSRHACVKVVNEVVAEENVELAHQSTSRRLEEGSNLEESEGVIEAEFFNKITLSKVVDKLHWYVHKGDTIVSLCCGATDFTSLVEQKLEENGKKCSFKVYNVCQPKKDLNVENSDWMSVNRKDLPTGTHLILVLNLPFGVVSSSLNKYIDKALEFKPKFLILFVPEETERLPEKEVSYDLVWEEYEKLSDEVLYEEGSLPLSVIMDQKVKRQMKQLSKRNLLFCLWSRSDWTSKHKAIALRQGHLPKNQKDSHSGENNHEAEILEDPKNDIHGHITGVSNQINEVPEQQNDDDENEETCTFNKIPLKMISRSPVKRKDLRRLLEDDESSDEDTEAPSENVVEVKHLEQIQRSEIKGKTDHNSIRTASCDIFDEPLTANQETKTSDQETSTSDRRNQSKELHEISPKSCEREEMAEGTDPSPQGSSSLHKEQTCKAKTVATVNEPLDSAAKKEPVSKKTDQFEKSKSNTDSDINFVLTFAPSPYHPFFHDQNNSCGWIDEE